MTPNQIIEGLKEMRSRYEGDFELHKGRDYKVLDHAIALIEREEIVVSQKCILDGHEYCDVSNCKCLCYKEPEKEEADEADEAEIENDLSDGRESEKKEDGKIFLNGLEVKYPEQMIYKKPKWPKIEKMPDTTIPNREFMKINEILDRLELIEKEL